jgi:outer membrane receptor protein involved in Fe transport
VGKELQKQANAIDFADLQTSEEESGDDTLDEGENIIKVIGRRVVRRNRTESIEPTLTYDTEFFQRFEPSTLQDMLKRVPGIIFNTLIPSRATGISSQASASLISFRGIPDRGGQILINGRRIPGINDNNTANFDAIPADMIKEIRLMRSPSAEYDSQGPGLTINVILKDGADIPSQDRVTWRASGQSAGGELGATVSMTNAGTLSDSANYSVNVSHSDISSLASSKDSETNTYSSYYNQDTTTDTELSEELSSLTGTFVQDFDDGSVINLTASLVDRTTQDTTLTDSSRQGRMNTSSQENEKRFGLAVDYEHPFDDDSILLLAISYDRAGLDGFNGDLFEDTSLRSYFDRERDEIKLNTKYELPLSDSQQLTLGIAAEENTNSDEDRSPETPSTYRNIQEVNSDESAFDAFVSYKIDFTDSIALQLGSRYESTDYSLDANYDTTTFAANLVSNVEGFTFKNSSNNPSLNLRWIIAPSHQLRFSAARKVSLPGLDSISPVVYVDNFGGRLSARTGSKFVEPERTDSFDVSYEYDFSKSGLVGLSIFYKETMDELYDRTLRTRQRISEALPNLAQIEAFLNQGDIQTLTVKDNRDAKIERQGVELDYSIPMHLLGLPSLSFSSNMSYVETKSNSITTYQFSGNVTLDHFIESLDVTYGLSYNYTPERKDVFIDEDYGETITEIDDRAPSLDIFLQKRFNDSLLLRLNIENALDGENVKSSETILGPYSVVTTESNEIDPIYSLTLRGSF